MAVLTNRQREIVEWIFEYQRKHRYSPSIRDLMQRFGINSPNGAMCHLYALKRKGCITWVPGVARTMRVISEDDRGIPVVDLEEVTSP